MTNTMPVLVREEPAQHLDHDGLWKKVITDLFEPFMLFFAPDLYEQLDWSKQPDSLEQELQDGKEQWILVHVEVQRDKEDDFAERMFQYFYRIFDKYNQKIYAIALLTDADRSFHPTSYDYHFHGTNLTYAYNTYKIWHEDEETLLHSSNPFALVVLAGKYALKSEKNADDRYQFKRRLFDLIIRHKNYSEAYTYSLFSFVDYLLTVPEEMNQKLQEEFESRAEEEVILMHNTSFPEPPTLKPIFDKLRREEEEVKRQNTKEIAEAMLQEGLPIATVIKVTGLNEDELDEIQNQN
ncbi:hypothetical protein [Natribacillus halophilus]|uniref:Transposase (putative) YhgA-like domain-containing protein n=1 Tax=Natribacillus halophilus TaxID=549003 RepID=A0A1G8P128_9BACI|nr:hypothetical protein [Natribacillus halophilus]SDI86251.1 conserved hypothetical protein (putative transposase or invertase) [Natribacillus halophilus]